MSDGSAPPPSQRIVEAIAAIDEVEQSELKPLNDVVDSDALDAFVESTGPDAAADDVSVSFRYSGHDVVVDGEGAVYVDRTPIELPAYTDLQACAHCGAALRSDVWYPVVLPENDDGDTELYTFCDDDCRDAWQSSASPEAPE
jgi:hypothetical protein